MPCPPVATLLTNDKSFLSALSIWAFPSTESAFLRSSEGLGLSDVSVGECHQLLHYLRRFKRVLLRRAARHSGAFLNARPCSSLGTCMDSSTLRIVIGLRLGVPLSAPHDCVCDAAVDCLGTRGFSCGGQRVVLHDTVRPMT